MLVEKAARRGRVRREGVQLGQARAGVGRLVGQGHVGPVERDGVVLQVAGRDGQTQLAEAPPDRARAGEGIEEGRFVAVLHFLPHRFEERQQTDFRADVVQAEADSGMMAVASISTSSRGSISARTPTSVAAGRMAPNTAPCAWPTASQSRAISVR